MIRRIRYRANDGDVGGYYAEFIQEADSAPVDDESQRKAIIETARAILRGWFLNDGSEDWHKSLGDDAGRILNADCSAYVVLLLESSADDGHTWATNSEQVFLVRFTSDQLLEATVEEIKSIAK